MKSIRAAVTESGRTYWFASIDGQIVTVFAFKENAEAWLKEK